MLHHGVVPHPVHLDAAVVLPDGAQQVQHQRHGVFRRLLGAVIQYGAHAYALFGGIVQIGLVVARGLEGNHPAVIHGVDLLFAEVDVAVHDDVGVLYLVIERLIVAAVFVEYSDLQLRALGAAGFFHADISVLGVRNFCQNYFHSSYLNYLIAPLLRMLSISSRE
jgi:hypothetical protein